MSEQAAMRVTILGTNNERLQQISAMLARRPGLTVTFRVGGLDRIALAADHDGADLVIVDQLCTSAADLESLSGPAIEHPGMSYLLIGATGSADWLLAAVQRGVRDILSLPLDETALGAAVDRIQRRLLARSHPTHKGRVVAFIGCKGGSGASFLAANTAYLLAAETSRSVVLLDLDLDGGDASLFLTEQPPALTLADLALQVERLDSTLFSSSLLHVLPNLGILASPDTLEQTLAISADHAEAVIQRSAADFDCVVMDLGHSFNRVTVRALDSAEAVVLVLQVSLPFIRDARRALATLQALGVSEDRIHLIVNRHEARTTLTVKDVEKALGRKVSLVIPNTYRVVSDSVNQGVPICILDPHAAVTQCLRTIAKSHFGVEPVVKNASGPRSWLAHLLNSL